ncbi:hypothetical protein EW146_g241 [Bondarzewia mesenterica]|uniref:Mediator of RNA polymerase II transcription subunit 19 n=1 Tax=Bondarzewia mesenterica TaxID=1095465 RepID=A0A4S4M815_9AGAM|nr:hypothetical protein EW146_g241 [Bondarzewia mesenterica]
MDMDVDFPMSSAPNTQENAIAGPSSYPDIPFLYLPPPVAPQPPPLLTSTQDLLSRFHLQSAYDKFVRPLVPPVDGQSSNHPPTPAPITNAAPQDKGKGRERDSGTPTPTNAPTPGVPPDGDEEEGKDGKKKKNTYKHLIKGIPGRHSMKKDDFLSDIIQVPPKQRIQITPFDLRTQRDAFSVSLEGLKGWNIHALVLESTQAREDRKKRKELKKLAKAQAAGILPMPSVSTPATAAVASPTPPTSARARSSTPRVAQTPLPMSVTAASQQLPRGVKRDHEDSVSQANTQGPGPVINGGGHTRTGGVPMPSAATPVGSKPGVAGARPRPVKKQRVDIQGQARAVHPPIQQPTPQGV